MSLHKGLIALIGLFAVATCLSAQSLADQWRQGLSGAKLTAYAGSVHSSNSSLTVLNICANGRYNYYREASWSAEGSAGGGSTNRITGRWDVRQDGAKIMITYVTDKGEQGAFPVFLQNNGRVNIGGVAYAVQQGAADC
ncbi:MAG: hypothetical protein K0U72_13530 [Gammaproteobacteria bacterium]|nr:hypothetical protein [Gammaproteobacteria bacterium]